MQFSVKKGLAVLGVLALTSGAQAQNLYVGDFSGNSVLRFNALTGGLPDAVIPSLTQPDHIQTTANDLYIAAFGDGAVFKYNRTNLAAPRTTLISLNNVIGLQLNPAGTELITTNTQGVQNASIRRYSITGSLLDTVDISGIANDPWSVRLDSANNRLLFSMGFFSNSANQGIYTLPLNFTSASVPTALVTGASLNGISRPGGIAILPNGDFFTVGSLFAGGPLRINRYNAAGSYLTTVTDGAGGAIFNNLSGFDLAIGPDGNLYATANPTSGGNGSVLKINATTNTFDSVFVGPAANIQIAKTLYFDSFAGSTAAPEPGTLALGALGLLGLVAARRRKH